MKLIKLRKWKGILLMALLIVTIVGCSEGGNSDNTPTVNNDSSDNSDNTPSVNNNDSFLDLSKVAIFYINTPTQNEEISISLDEEGDIGLVEWAIVTEPTGSNIILCPSNDGKSVTFVPVIAGDYKIKVKSISNSSEQNTNFVIKEEFTFDKLKVEGYDGTGNIEEVIGVIQNQVWVFSVSLAENEISTIVANYPQLAIIGYDDVQGLLVEFNEQSFEALEAIESLKFEKGIDSVVERVFEGKDVPRDEQTPDDGSAFNDGGDNWHLEKIEVTTAWDYSTGSNNILIGICDSGYFKNHEDLIGRFTEIKTSSCEDHGTSVAGCIGANSNNKKGISGINWISKIVAGENGYRGLISVINTQKKNLEVLVVNNSWSIPGYVQKDFNPYNQSMSEKRLKKARKSSRKYRKAAKGAYKDKLFIWSAGNGVGNGDSTSGYYGVDSQYHSGAIHLDDDGKLDKLNNVILVAALKNDDRLVYYSNYGKSVELAAPVGYKSTKINNRYDTNFWGTSAAAPIITGVASLIYSLYPGFTPKDVKDILISSATTKVTERYKAPGNAEDNNSNIEALNDQIPILNAAKALKKAQELINSKVKISHSYPDPFKAEASIQFTSLDSDLEIIMVEWQIESSSTGQESWQLITGSSTQGKIIKSPMSSDTPFHRVIAVVTLQNPNSTVVTQANKEYQFTYSDIMITSNNPPIASITNPLDAATFLEGDKITFTGIGTDTEDEILTDDQLVWISNIDHQIGTGTSFTINNLSANTHTIILNVTDQGGAKDTDTITIFINPLSQTISVGQKATIEEIIDHFSNCYNRNGGEDVLFYPTSEVYYLNGYQIQNFADSNSIILYNSSLEYAYLIQGTFLEKYLNKVSDLGQAISEQVKGSSSKPTNSTCIYQNFENGAIEIFESGDHQGKAIVILNPFFQKWADLDYANSDLGYPIEDASEEKTSSFGTKYKYQNFEGGSLEWLIESDQIVEIHGAIYTRWKDLNYAQGLLGLPIEDEKEATISPLSNWTGRYSIFEGGIMHWLREENKTVVIGLNQPGAKVIADKYHQEGGSGGELGFPTIDDYLRNDGELWVNFEDGYIGWTDAKGIINYSPSSLADSIIFLSNRDGNLEIYITDPNQLYLINLTNNSADDYVPSVSSDGKRIAFVSDRSGDKDIFTMSITGLNILQLTTASQDDGLPLWSPDGTKIAFVSERDYNKEIYIMDKDGTEKIRLTNNPGDDYCSSWSPDSSKIAFVSNRDGDKEIYTINLDGSGLITLTNNSTQDDLPFFAPDGSKIAFLSNRSDDFDLFTMDTNGENIQKLTTDETDYVGWFCWSPDSSKIAFDSKKDGDYEIYVINADGTNMRQLTDNNTDDKFSSWTRDGLKIVFISERDGNKEVYVMDPDGGYQVNLSNDDTEDDAPIYSPIYDEGGGCFIDMLK